MPRVFFDARGLARSIRAGTARGLASFARDVADGARERVPVDTGALRASVREVWSPSRGFAGARSDAPHSRVVEYGTAAVPARPAFRRALAAALSRLGSRFRYLRSR